MTDAQLRRRLRAEGWTFRTETDRVRRAILVERHAAKDSLATIALALGYNDQAAFNRAVKRWYGVPPGRWTPELPLVERNQG